MRLLIALLLFAAPLSAHPAVGLVRDSRGNFYYSDLHNVWRLTADGKKSIVVRNVHTHELSIDENDNVYGEHLWYEGDATKKWGHRVWRLSSGGRVVDIFPAREGFLSDYSFVRDRSGNVYWSSEKEIRKRRPDGRIVTHARGDFRNVRRMAVTPSGTLYFVDGKSVRRLQPNGRVATIADDLRERRLENPFTWVNDTHNIMGIWVDERENVYLAVYGGRMVKRIAPDGRVSIVDRSPDGWSPTGGYAARGELWVLEGRGGEMRVRRAGMK